MNDVDVRGITNYKFTILGEKKTKETIKVRTTKFEIELMSHDLRLRMNKQKH